MLLSILSSIAVLAAAPAAGPGEAQTLTADLKRPAYTRLPTLDELIQYYPPDAMRAEVKGGAVLSCVAALSRKLEGCVVESERPAEQGFGAAALGIAALIEVSPAEANGTPVAVKIRVPIAFKLPGDVLPGWEGTLRCYGLLSVHADAAPKDKRMAEGVAAARARAAALGEARGLSRAEVKAALGEAVAATPAPAGPGATQDRCFTTFL